MIKTSGLTPLDLVGLFFYEDIRANAPIRDLRTQNNNDKNIIVPKKK